MANMLFTPQAAATSAIAALNYLSVLPKLVNLNFSSEFIPGRGATVNVPKPIELTGDGARTYTKAQREAREAIIFDELSQGFVPVTMDTQVYRAVREPDDFLTFTLQQAEQQVIAPMAQSVVEGLTKPLVDIISSTTVDSSIPAVKADGSNALASFIATRKVLSQRKVPQGGRTMAVGAGVEAAILNIEQLQKVNEAGTPDMLRNATIGNLFGFTIVADYSMPDDLAVAFDRDAFALVTRPTKAPNGAAFTSTVAAGGFSLRWLQHYNPLQLEDQVVLDAFVGAAVLDEKRAVAFKLA